MTRNLARDKALDQALLLFNKSGSKQEYARHFNAATIDEAVSLLSVHSEAAGIIAGGVDVVSLMKSAVRAPKILVNIKTIPGLSYITEDFQGLKIGSLTTIREIENSDVIRGRYSMLAEAARSAASPQVRNMATAGGNLCQEVRCWYYRRSPVTGKTFFCRRKGGEHCFAIAGENAYHAIFEGDACRAVCPSDLAPALTALGASVRTAGLRGVRVIALEDFYLPLGNVLQPHEVITEIQIPKPAPGTSQRFLKFRVRKAIDFAICSVAAVINSGSDNVVKDARIVLGAVAGTPYRALRAEELLRGAVVTENIAEAAAKAAISEAVPLSKNAYKIDIARALVKRAIVDRSVSMTLRHQLA